jgi:hypothetical protein
MWTTQKKRKKNCNFYRKYLGHCNIAFTLCLCAQVTYFCILLSNLTCTYLQTFSTCIIYVFLFYFTIFLIYYSSGFTSGPMSPPNPHCACALFHCYNKFISYYKSTHACNKEKPMFNRNKALKKETCTVCLCFVGALLMQQRKYHVEHRKHIN